MKKNTQTSTGESEPKCTVIDLFDSVMARIEPLLLTSASEDLQRMLAVMPEDQKEAFSNYCSLCIDLCLEAMEVIIDQAMGDVENLKKKIKSISTKKERAEQQKGLSGIEHILDEA